MRITAEVCDFDTSHKQLGIPKQKFNLVWRTQNNGIFELGKTPKKV